MAARANSKYDAKRVSRIVLDAGGRIVGRTKLQKLAYLMEATGLGEGFAFEYHRYGPYSEELETAAHTEELFGALKEEEHPTTWGGFYSVYTVANPIDGTSNRTQLAQIAVEASSVELELAATAAFLAAQGIEDPWLETAKRKPKKANQTRLDKAKQLYKRLQCVETPKSLPAIV